MSKYNPIVCTSKSYLTSDKTYPDNLCVTVKVLKPRTINSILNMQREHEEEFTIRLVILLPSI